MCDAHAIILAVDDCMCNNNCERESDTKQRLSASTWVVPILRSLSYR